MSSGQNYSHGCFLNVQYMYVIPSNDYEDYSSCSTVLKKYHYLYARCRSSEFSKLYLDIDKLYF